MRDKKLLVLNSFIPSHPLPWFSHAVTCFPGWRALVTIHFLLVRSPDYSCSSLYLFLVYFILYFLEVERPQLHAAFKTDKQSEFTDEHTDASWVLHSSFCMSSANFRFRDVFLTTAECWAPSSTLLCVVIYHRVHERDHYSCQLCKFHILPKLSHS